MTTAPDPLVVRQHERLTCRLPAMLRVAEEHATQVIFARTAGDSSGTLDVTVVDCSRGGMGLESRLFLPRTCRVQVQLRNEAGFAPPVDLIFSSRVQRIVMTNRTPTYYVGLAFVVDSPDHARHVERLLTYVREHAAPPAAPIAAAPKIASAPEVRRAV